ncbi:hypothetical protein BDK92_1094 [Micromonospora pisi]|uniref:Uncharacterized protein n=1 Tax=Micromonospora pisi TaxID=589240 RepID=A0A495JCT8_9ACTN|nr:hypothetical protein [Micromonospora pisi]RKR86826.1 hypothetical protein BDK92_1094 [Micromonospora pisi]
MNPRTDSKRAAVGGCLGLLFAVIVFSVGVLLVLVLAMAARIGYIPAYAQLACRISGCGRLGMAGIGWATTALPVVAVALLLLLRRSHPRLFRALLPLAVLLVGSDLLLLDYSFRGGGHAPYTRDLMVGVGGAGPFLVGLRVGRWAGALALLAYLCAREAMPVCPPGRVWAWQLVRLAAPFVMLPALLVALLAA